MNVFENDFFSGFVDIVKLFEMFLNFLLMFEN